MHGVCVARYVDDDLFFVVLGTTPQRREFEYPRMLSRTAPHEKILEEYRKRYMEDEAVATALPSDTDDDTVKLSLCLHIF